MFRIGEFAQIGRVSARMLRHYERLGLIRPDRTDPVSGYRYYSAGQLPRLNRLVALKGLGFSLAQVERLLDDDVPVEELRGMLAMRKAQIERALAQEEAKLRQVESRLLQIEQQGALADYDVAVKAEPARPFLSLRRRFADFAEAVGVVAEVARAATRQLKDSQRDRLTVIAHSDFEDTDIDLEIGVALTRPVNSTIRLPSDQLMAHRELEPVDEMASLVRSGPVERAHLAYGALGIWMEANDYAIAGPCREVFLELPRPGDRDVVMEIQFPVRRHG